jgi:esterase/lipase
MAAKNAKHIATHSHLLTENIRHSQWFDAELVALSRIDWYGQHFSSICFLTLKGHLALKIAVPLDTVHHSCTPVNISTRDILNRKIIYMFSNL